MTAPNVFAHVVRRFAAQPENIATEALAYVLGQSDVASSSMHRFALQLGADARVCNWQTQFSFDDDSTPDLIGLDDGDHPALIIEAKFWAGLTDRQPVAYLAHLPAARPGLLLVLAPAVRVELLWRELTRRVIDHDLQLGASRSIGSEVRAMAIGTNHVLAIASWRAALGFVAEALNAASDHGTASDLAQLAGLCESMDTDAFLPLQAEELTGSTAVRIDQYVKLVDDAVSRLLNDGIVSSKDVAGRALGSSAGTVWWGRWFNVDGWVCLLRVTPGPWSRHRATPIWLQVGRPSDPPPSTSMRALASLAETALGRVVDQTTFLDVAIDLPTAVERDEVLKEMIRQVSVVCGLIRDFLAKQSRDPAPVD